MPLSPSKMQLDLNLFPMQMPYTPDGQEVQEQVALDALRINKNFARDLIAKTLPVPEAVVQAHQKILLDIGKEYRDKRLKVSGYRLCARVFGVLSGRMTPRPATLH